MAKEFSDDGLPLTEGDTAGGECVPQIVDANIRQIGQLADAPPRLLHVGQMLAFDVSRDDIKFVPATRDAVEQLDGDRAEIRRFPTRLRIWEEGQISVQVRI